MSKLKFVALSGSTGVTENMYVYEYGNDMIIADCGVGFPDASMYGVDLVIPDFSYVLKNQHKLRGVLITHGHEDHLGAIPYLIKEMGHNVPLYASKLTAGFIRDKLEDHGLESQKVNVFSPEKDTLTLGNFKVTPFLVSHSVPDAVGFCIDTPVGKAFHVPDYKFDWTPVSGKPFDITKVAMLAQEGALLLSSDSLGSTHPGHTESERSIESIIDRIVSNASGVVFFTTISSNISRMQQALDVAKANKRYVCMIGRSIMVKTDIAKKLGYLNYPKGLVITPNRAKKMPRHKVMYIISGSYGQSGSALYRVVTGDHDYLKIQDKDTVIFSADPAPPGSKTNVDNLVDMLIERDIEVHYYDMQENLHVSGHGSQEDIKLLFAIVKPKFYIPIGGTIRHNRGYKQLAIAMGAQSDNVLELSPGDVVEFTEDSVKKRKSIPVREVLVDGLGVGDVGNVVLRDRKVLARDGVAIVLLQMDMASKNLSDIPEIISRGFVFEKEEKEFLKQSAIDLKNHIDGKKINNLHMLKSASTEFLEKYFFENTGRRPMILPAVVEV